MTIEYLALTLICREKCIKNGRQSNCTRILHTPLQVSLKIWKTFRRENEIGWNIKFLVIRLQKTVPFKHFSFHCFLLGKKKKKKSLLSQSPFLKESECLILLKQFVVYFFSGEKIPAAFLALLLTELRLLWTVINKVAAQSETFKKNPK